MASGRNRGKQKPERRGSCPGRKWAQWILLLSANGNISLFQPKLVLLRARAKSQLQVRAEKNGQSCSRFYWRISSLRLREPKSMYVGSGSKAGLPLVLSL